MFMLLDLLYLALLAAGYAQSSVAALPPPGSERLITATGEVW